MLRIFVIYAILPLNDIIAHFRKIRNPVCRIFAYSGRMSNEFEKTYGPTISSDVAYKEGTFAAWTRCNVYRESENGMFDNGGNLVFAVAPNILAPSIIETQCTFSEIGVSVEADMQLNSLEAPSYNVNQLTFTGYMGQSVTLPTINKIPIDAVVHANLPILYGYDGDKLFGLINWSCISNNVPFKQLRKNCPMDDVLRWAYRVYAVASISGMHPTKSVADTFGIPLRTASYWVKSAKERFAGSLKHESRSLFDLNKHRFENYCDIDNEEVRIASKQFIEATLKHSDGRNN